MSQPTNGQSPAQQAAHAQMAEAVYQGYNQLARQLGAIMILLENMPLALLLEANKRHQTVSPLLMPAQVTAEQAATAAASFRNDERVITALLEAQRVMAEIASGR